MPAYNGSQESEQKYSCHVIETSDKSLIFFICGENEYKPRDDRKIIESECFTDPKDIAKWIKKQKISDTENSSLHISEKYANLTIEIGKIMLENSTRSKVTEISNLVE